MYLCFFGDIMTIAIAMKINDGIILATDSASTILGQNENGDVEVHHTYFTADKLFNLKKGSPIGAMTWGSGSINDESISTLVKDFRSSENNNDEDLSVSNTVDKFVEFLKPKLSNEVDIGFLIVGYSANESHPEMFLIEINNGQIVNKTEINQDNNIAVSWFGDVYFLCRLLFGYDEHLPEILKDNGLSDENINLIIGDCNNKLQLPLGVPAMPIQDAIDLVKFLAESCVNFSRFTPGPQFIGGPIDLAVITKHEGFKWIERKHYFKQDLNLTTGGI